MIQLSANRYGLQVQDPLPTIDLAMRIDTLRHLLLPIACTVPGISGQPKAPEKRVEERPVQT